MFTGLTTTTSILLFIVIGIAIHSISAFNRFHDEHTKEPSKKFKAFSGDLERKRNQPAPCLVYETGRKIFAGIPGITPGCFRVS